MSKQHVQHKFRIGNRKSGKSALKMKNEDLIAAHKKHPKDRSNIEAVLKMRGVDVDQALNEQ